MDIVNTIIPIFIVITIGWIARLKGFIAPEFLAPANRLVYYIGIPAMVFRSIAKTSFHAQFNPKVLGVTVIAISVVFAAVWSIGKLSGINRTRLGSFVQASVHGNLGYFALAVAFYLLGTEGFARTGIISVFVMILQNLLAVIVMQVCSRGRPLQGNFRKIIFSILGNPIIISAVMGTLFSVFGIPVPIIAQRSLEILGNLALPTALLLIGASLSFDVMRTQMTTVLSSSAIKLLILPAAGFALFRLLGLNPLDFLPGLIILSAPTATVTYVMAKELQGDADFAVVAISTSTILAAVTCSMWLAIAG